MKIGKVLRDATGDREPDVSRLMQAVPALLAEASRRRHVERREGTAAITISLAWKAIPRLAAVAALLILISTGLFIKDATSRESTGENLDTVILGVGDAEDAAEWILGGIVDQEGEDG